MFCIRKFFASKEILKYIFCCLYLLALLSVAIQYKFKKVKFCEAKTFGECFVSFVKQDFQKEFEKQVKDDGKFAKEFRKIDSTIIFKLFSSTNSGVIVGKNDFLFEKPYIDEKFTINSDTGEKLNELAIKIKKVQDIFYKNNIKFLYIIAPTKADFYSEFLPSKFQCIIVNSKSNKRNYTILKEKLDKYKINYIDANEFYIKNKNIAEYPLMTKYGIHWSNYGFYYFFNQHLNPIFFNNSISCELKVSKKQYGSDFDLGSLMNLEQKYFRNEKLANFYNCKTSEKLPKVLLIGDSFTDIFYNNLKDIFNDGLKQFRWWYYKRYFKFDGSETNDLTIKDKIKVVKDKDIIIFVNTTPNILNEDLIKFFDDIINEFKGK